MDKIKLDFSPLENTKAEEKTKKIRKILFTSFIAINGAVLPLNVCAYLVADRALKQSVTDASMSIIFIISPILVALNFIYLFLTETHKTKDDNRLAEFAKINNLIFDPFGKKDTRGGFRRRLVFNNENLEFGFINYEPPFSNPETTKTSAFYLEKTVKLSAINLTIDSKNSDHIKVFRLGNKKLVSLEGNFNEFFNIQVEDSEISKKQATAFLTPDLMAWLIDNFQRFDVEIFENKIRIYYFVNDIALDVNSSLIILENLPTMLEGAEKMAQKINLLENIKA